MGQPPKDRRKLLIIDDEAGLRSLMRFDFTGRGYGITLAASGEEAIAKARAERFDLAFCDIRMPGIDGLETLRQLKRLQPDLQVVMVTGFPSLETAAQALSSGAADYMAKPYNLDHLAYVFDQVMATRQAAAKAPSGALSDFPAPFSAKARQSVCMAQDLRMELGILEERGLAWSAPRKEVLARVLGRARSLARLCEEASCGAPSPAKTRQAVETAEAIGMEVGALRESGTAPDPFEEKIFERAVVKARCLAKFFRDLSGYSI
jgi:CheY-like chemotaxis protein